MTPAEWTVVKEITAEALALEGSDRARHLAARCGTDERLRLDVESLLDSIASAADLYENPQLSTGPLGATFLDDASGAPSLVGGRIGPYRVLSELGSGGMGAAYLAIRDDDTYQKRVAIKLIKRGMDTDAILRRFRRERQILANLEHPNIVMLLDGGTTDDGLPYFVMEYVQGVPIDVFCNVHGLPIDKRLALFQAVCTAVHHAHLQHVVHRDLKPSNILVTANGVPKLLDFGIATLLNSEELGQTADPTVLARVMTPQYASPEQMRGETATAASDVYSLGVLLYLLVAGEPPYQLAGTRREAERIVCEQVPARPSASAGLNTIVLTALQKKPERRYRSVADLSADVQRHLGGHAIAARPNGGRQRLFAGALALAAILIAAAIAVVAGRPERAPVSATRSIAVLPFASSGGDAEFEYVSEGIAEDIVSRLSRLPGLKVIGRDSARRSSAADPDPVRVGRALGVDVVLTGRVIHAGADVTIAAQLVNAADRRVLWSERYQRPLDDVQVSQRELAQQVAAKLRPQLTPAEGARIATRHTADAEAYRLYLRGRYFWNRRTPDGFRRAIGLLSDAVDRDPSFALAWAGLADSYGLLTEYHESPAEETYEPMKRAVTTALALDPLLAEAHTSLGFMRRFYEWDAVGADRHYRRALELNPNYATGRQWYAEFLSASGRHDEALAEIRTAVSLEPVSLIVNSVEAWVLYMAGRFDESIVKSQQVIELDPNFPEVWEYLKRGYDQKGLYRDAIAARQNRRRALGRDLTETPALAAAAAATTARDYWQQRLAQEIIESKAEGTMPYEFVEILAQVGDIKGSLDWLERACAEHDFMLTYIRVAPNLRPLHREPRYTNLVRRGCGL